MSNGCRLGVALSELSSVNGDLLSKSTRRKRSGKVSRCPRRECARDEMSKATPRFVRACACALRRQRDAEDAVAEEGMLFLLTMRMGMRRSTRAAPGAAAGRGRSARVLPSAARSLSPLAFKARFFIFYLYRDCYIYFKKQCHPSKAFVDHFNSLSTGPWKTYAVAALVGISDTRFYAPGNFLA